MIERCQNLIFCVQMDDLYHFIQLLSIKMEIRQITNYIQGFDPTSIHFSDPIFHQIHVFVIWHLNLIFGRQTSDLTKIEKLKIVAQGGTVFRVNVTSR